MLWDGTTRAEGLAQVGELYSPATIVLILRFYSGWAWGLEAFGLGLGWVLKFCVYLFCCCCFVSVLVLFLNFLSGLCRMLECYQKV